MTEVRELYDYVLDSSDLSQMCSSEALKNIKKKLEENKGKLTTRNSVLWLQYLDMVDVLKMILKLSARETGNYIFSLYINASLLFSIWTYTLCKNSICIPTNNAKITRDKPRSAPQI